MAAAVLERPGNVYPGSSHSLSIQKLLLDTSGHAVARVSGGRCTARHQ
jgi:hypothetical protein